MDDINLPQTDGIPLKPTYSITIRRKTDNVAMVDFTDLLFYINGDWVKEKKYTRSNAKYTTIKYMDNPDGFDLPYLRGKGMYKVEINPI